MALNNNNNFLQSDIWRKFQEAVDRKTFIIKTDDFYAGIIEHRLPVVGKYFYIPKGPIMKLDSSTGLGITNIISLAKKENAGWVRIDPENNQALELIKNNVSLPIKKAPHDMQPREILVMDIAKLEEELLAEMKPKTRYNIRLAEKRGVNVFSISNSPNYLISNEIPSSNDKDKKYYIDKFIELVNLTAKRKRISFHSANYYQKMLEVIPGDILKLYVAEYNDKIIAANLIVFYGNTATYLHGATDDEYRNVMAPYLLQWQAIKDAKKAGYKFYDFGGVCSDPTASGHFGRERSDRYDAWSGITKFKTGFAPTTEPVIFPGSHDVIVSESKYWKYKILSFILGMYKKITK